MSVATFVVLYPFALNFYKEKISLKFTPLCVGVAVAAIAGKKHT